ncbi:hypothetical protein [uncultured Chryseobacterium sp.]|uniref:hypothetical protein n=1 Tax=uncultured Chryseobacterium sp. TaxID=259322 RepID=UPI0026020547|nr:hypothetical protein [uncultured Chryseobacterium sp.]
MNKTLLLIFFLVCCHQFKSQIISGKIQTESGNIINDVNIYIDGTKISTTSKVDGSFQLDTQGQKSGNIIFQKDNYETSIFPIQQAIGKTVKVIINPVNEIEEIVLIPFTEEAYRNYINYFLNYFIGFDRENVRIKNQRTLKFSYDKRNKILIVKAPQTLIIENKKLGYTIQYNLLNFEADFNSKSVKYLGSSLFKEDNNKKNEVLNRMNAYQGSLMHFFRSLYNNELAKEGFIVNHARRIPNPKYPTEEELKKLDDYMALIKTQKIINLNLPKDLDSIYQRKSKNSPFVLAVVKTNIPESYFTKRENGKLFIDFNELLMVNYQKKNFEIKKGEFVKSEAIISQTSIINPELAKFEIFKEGISSEPDLFIVEDEFSRQNISKMLPLDYKLGD